METKKKVGIAATILAALAAFLLLGKKAEAQQPDKATLWGIVTDATTGSPVAGINVTLDSLSTTTNSSGKYEFLNIEPGTYSSLTFSDPLGRYDMRHIVLTEEPV